MAKTIAVASKFSEEELDKIDYFVQKNKTTRSALFHDLVMQGVNNEKPVYEYPNNVQEVIFTFTDNFAYFWKGRTYKGMIYGEDASIYFGGEWKQYKLAELPVEY